MTESHDLTIRKVELIKRSDSTRPVSFLSEQEIYAMSENAAGNKDNGRNKLLVLTMFQCALRVSEAIGLRPKDKLMVDGAYILGIMGKGHKPRLVACPEKLYFQLGNYASENNLLPDDKFFPITRIRAWQIIKAAAKRAGIDRRVYNHLLRHSGAVARLRRTGNPKSLQIYLGHSDMKMTMRYLATTQVADSIQIEKDVKFD